MNNTTTDDYFIILGDVGINYTGDIEDIFLKDIMRETPITFLCIRGNHEERPENIASYKEVEMFGDTVYIEPDYPNVIWLKDGGEYTIDGKTFLAIGGAYSIDKKYRIDHGWKWFESEQLTEQERNDIYNKVKGKRYDIVLTHTAPVDWEPTEIFLPGIDQSKVDKTTENWLKEVRDNIGFGKWFFGHYHGEKSDTSKGYEMLYKNIKKLR